jgi:hypothetical protein
MLQLLASEAGFLVNTEVQEQLDSLPVEEANLVRAESMLKALGVKNQQRLNALLTYFFKDPNADVGNNPWDFDPLAAKKEEKKDEEEVDEDELLLHYASEDINELKDMIRPEQVRIGRGGDGCVRPRLHTFTVSTHCPCSHRSPPTARP